MCERECGAHTADTTSAAQAGSGSSHEHHGANRNQRASEEDHVADVMAEYRKRRAAVPGGLRLTMPDAQARGGTSHAAATGSAATTAQSEQPRKRRRPLSGMQRSPYRRRRRRQAGFHAPRSAATWRIEGKSRCISGSNMQRHSGARFLTAVASL